MAIECTCDRDYNCERPGHDRAESEEIMARPLDGEIAPGTRVRSFDYEARDLEGIRANYIEGELLGYEMSREGYRVYRIAADFRISGGGEIDPGSAIYLVPVNGLPTLMGRETDGVEAIVPMVLSYGMGVDSTAIILRWLEDPTSRNFSLRDLIILTAQTGNEFKGTGALVDAHIIPRLRAAGVRFVEVGRTSRSQTDGITILQDSTSPGPVHLKGAYTLADELEHAGTIPASGGVHLCSIKSKGQPLDLWIDQEMNGRAFTHVMGFNADETGRAVRDTEARAKKGELSDAYRIAFGFNADETKRIERGLAVRSDKGQAAPEYPLLDWGWNYQDCLDYIEKITGAKWLKSCCSFCPFAGGRKPILERYREEPEAAVQALRLELTARTFNERMALYKTKSLYEIVSNDGNTEALEAFHSELAEMSWSIYEVRRIYSGPGSARRSIRRVQTEPAEMTLEDARKYLAQLARVSGMEVQDLEGPVHRMMIREREDAVYPADERFLVISPAGFADKDGCKNFDEKWDAHVSAMA